MRGAGGRRSLGSAVLAGCGTGQDVCHVQAEPCRPLGAENNSHVAAAADQAPGAGSSGWTGCAFMSGAGVSRDAQHLQLAHPDATATEQVPDWHPGCHAHDAEATIAPICLFN